MASLLLASLCQLTEPLDQSPQLSSLDGPPGLCAGGSPGLQHHPSLCSLCFGAAWRAALSGNPSWPPIAWAPHKSSQMPLCIPSPFPVLSPPGGHGDAGNLPSDSEGKASHLPSYFRHLWPLKDLTLTTNQVRGWAGYLPRRGRPEPQLGPGLPS